MITLLEVTNTMDGIKIEDAFFDIVPEFKAVKEDFNDKAVLFIVCMYDYWSPYRNISIKDREKAIGKDIYGTTGTYKKLLTHKSVLKAIKKYKELQYDPILDSYNTATKKIKDINSLIDKEEVNISTIKSVQDAIKGNEKIYEMLMSMQKHIDDIARRSPFRGFTSIEDYHS